MNIYIDLGNTYCKFLLSGKKDIFFQIKTLNLNYSSLKKHLNKYKIAKQEIKNILISSVVPKKNTYLNKFFKNYYLINPHFIKENDFINMDYSLIKSNIGADILVNTFFANSISEKSIIISLGTATVISFVNKDKIKGSFILPGLIISYDSLINKAAKLKKSSISKLKTLDIIGTDTNSSIYLGTIKGHFLQILALIRTVELKQESKIFITGGNFSLLKEYFDKEFIYEFIDNMVLKGLKHLNTKINNDF